jgi:hypothetical protein
MIKKHFWLKQATNNNYNNFHNGTIISSFHCAFCGKFVKPMPANFLELLYVDRHGFRDDLNGFRQLCDTACLNLWILEKSSAMQITIEDYKEEFEK